MMQDTGLLRRIALPVLLLVVWGLLCQWLVPSPPRFDTTADNTMAQWTLPPLGDQVAREEAYQTLLRVQPWGRKVEQKVEVIPWRFYGVMDVGSKQYALVGQGDQVHRYGVGDTLPQGEKVVTIGKGSIELTTPNGARTVYLYVSPTGFKPNP